MTTNSVRSAMMQSPLWELWAPQQRATAARRLAERGAAAAPSILRTWEMEVQQHRLRGSRMNILGGLGLVPPLLKGGQGQSGTAFAYRLLSREEKSR
jgi:hypothetical protein